MYYLLILLHVSLHLINLGICSEFVPCPEPWHPKLSGKFGVVRDVETCPNSCKKYWATITSYENKSFLCYHRIERAYPLLIESQENNHTTCECAYKYYDRIKRENDFLRCDPPKQYINITAHSIECSKKCKKLKLLIYSNYGSRRIQDCGDLLTHKTNKSHSKPLRGNRIRILKNEKRYLGCVCGLNKSDLIKNNEEELDTDGMGSLSINENEKEFIPCPEPWKATLIRPRPFLSPNDCCALKCGKRFGFLLPNEKIICYHRLEKAVSIPNDNNMCECGHRVKIQGRLKLQSIGYERCDPPKIFDDILENKLCKIKCKKINLLLYRPRNHDTIIRDCGNLITDEKSRISKPRKLDGLVTYRIRLSDNSRLPECQCGLNFNSKLKYMNFNSNITLTKHWMDQVPRKKRTPKTYMKKVKSNNSP